MSTAAPARRLSIAQPSNVLTVAALRPGSLFQTVADPSRILVPLTTAQADVSETGRVWCVIHQTQRPTECVGQLIAVDKAEPIQIVAPVNPLPRFMVVSP